jgi:hypothetical protein
VFETANDLIANKNISALEPIQMLALLQYVLTLNNTSERTRIAEIVHPHGHGHPKISEPFLTSTPSLAHRPVATAREVN